jgi:GTP-binding protein
MFVDRASIVIRAGNGGNGAVSFRRMKYEPKGGPDGGNGGDGGDVVLQAESGMTTLYDFKFQRVWAANDGDNGGRKQCSGLRGEDLILRLPPGTMLFDEATGALVHDLKPGERIIIAKGGRGGFGNEHFKRSDYQSPKMSEAGHAGQTLEVRLELKVIADVGLVGMPNAGKSTLLASLTKATPKIANYPFTTLSPQLGVCEVGHKRRLVIADIPGLIEGASDGAGLGLDFLRHVERTKVIVHMLDCMPDNGLSPAKNYDTIREELAAFSQPIADKRELVVLTKLDLYENEKDREAALKQVARDLGLRIGKQIIGISSASRAGLRELMDRMWSMVHPQGDENPGWKAQPREGEELAVKTPQDHVQPVQTTALRPATPVLKSPVPQPEDKPEDKPKPKPKPRANSVRTPARKKQARVSKPASRASTKRGKPASKANASPARSAAAAKASAKGSAKGSSRPTAKRLGKAQASSKGGTKAKPRAAAAAPRKALPKPTSKPASKPAGKPVMKAKRATR